MGCPCDHQLVLITPPAHTHPQSPTLEPDLKQPDWLRSGVSIQTSPSGYLHLNPNGLLVSGSFPDRYWWYLCCTSGDCNFEVLGYDPGRGMVEGPQGIHMNFGATVLCFSLLAGVWGTVGKVREQTMDFVLPLAFTFCSRWQCTSSRILYESGSADGPDYVLWKLSYEWTLSYR